MSEDAKRMEVRVYYEDTDFSGRVYHASYLRFFERGRTEWLRAHGLQHDRLAQSAGVGFAVVKLQAEYLGPAFIDDLLTVTTSLRQATGPILRFDQQILRDDAVLVTGLIEVVTIKDNRAVRPPREILQILAGIKRR